MKNLLIVANWKANKTEDEAIKWLEGFYTGEERLGNLEGKKIIVCPPFTLLLQIRKYIDANGMSLVLGSQDLSGFEAGAYTGEIPAEIIGSIVKYSIIGHSERRRNLNETDELLKNKVNRAMQNNIIPIYCIQNENTLIPEGVEVVAYEPIEAIGTGNPDTPENADSVASEVKLKNKSIKQVLYGGSVKGDNVKGFTSMGSIDGVLVGGASLDPENFLEIIKQC